MTTAHTTAVAAREKLAQRIEVLKWGIKPPLFKGKPLKGFLGLGTGAGPQGKQFYVVDPNNAASESMISVPVYPEHSPLYKTALGAELLIESHLVRLDNGILLKSVPIPTFLSQQMSDGSILASHGYFTFHSYRTLASIMGYGCIHFRNNEPCKYCEIGSVGEAIRGFPSQHEISGFLEALEIACNLEPVRSLTITAGTFSEDRNEVLRRYMELCAKIKALIPSLSIHIQHEPVTDLSLHAQSATCADTVGIFLEVLDEELRRQICPGKARISREEYLINFKAAVAAYGRGNVTTTCLLGFGESLEKVLQAMDEYTQLGVKTPILFVRPNNSNLANYIPTYLDSSTDELVDFFIEAARIHRRNGLGSDVGNGAGCIGCMGCSALREAEELITSGPGCGA